MVLCFENQNLNKRATKHVTEQKSQARFFRTSDPEETQHLDASRPDVLLGSKLSVPPSPCPIKVPEDWAVQGGWWPGQPCPQGLAL